VYLFRHGETDANVARRWQGRSDSDLTEDGRAQAERLAATAPALDRVFTSPSARARKTAAAVAEAQALSVATEPDLAEIDFGAWEGLTRAEAAALHPDLFDRIHSEGRDEPRGHTGESFRTAGERLRDVIEGTLGNSSPSEAVGLFTHGGVARAYVTGLLGIPFADRDRIRVMGNTARARVDIRDGSALLAAYNVAPHHGG
jgi:broad specificity phosphatase PhoE